MLKNCDYCDYETCVALKELGFGSSDRVFPDYFGQYRIHLWDAQKWLREEKNLFIEVFVYEGQCGYRVKDTLNEFYDRDLHYYDSRHVIRKEGFLFSSYEEALSEGIKEAVKILKRE